MFRFLGIVTGSILAFGALLALLGTPEFHLASGEDVSHGDATAHDTHLDRENSGGAADEPLFDVTSDTGSVADRSDDAAQPVTAGARRLQAGPQDIVASAEEAMAPPGQLAGDAVAGTEPGAATGPDPIGTVADAATWPEPFAAGAVPDIDTRAPNPATPPGEPVPDTQPGWQTFWNPFRSEIAANGFVRRLESVTGLDYRVIRVRSGVYEVAFSYADDAERDRKLSQIAAVTGLDLSDGAP